jgi:antitoxin PrlF
MSVLARITSKGQTTIPKEVRAALAVGSGDSLVWDIRPDGRVEVRRAQPMDLEFHRALEGTLGEWACKEDEEAYRGL